MIVVGLPRASATHDPTDFTITASILGWNSTLPPGSVIPCSPSATRDCNPTVIEFRAVAFTATVSWKDDVHDFALYTKGFQPENVNALNSCNPSKVNGCLARTGFVSSTSPVVPLTFTPNRPLDDLSGPGSYEYYCEFHPFDMHGTISLFKSPDLNGDGTVTILDIARIAVAFDSTPASPNWNAAADIDNEGHVNIVDIARAASYFEKTLID